MTIEQDVLRVGSTANSNDPNPAAQESEFRPARKVEESVAMMASAEALSSDFSTVRRCGSWRS